MTLRRLAAIGALILTTTFSFGAEQGLRLRVRVGTSGGAVGGGANPIAAGRLPAADTTLPNTIWAAAGVVGGIPTRSTRCGSVISAYTGTAGTINTAISGCTANQYVELGSGTFTLSSGIVFGGHANATLRGQGADATKIIFTNDASSGGLFAGIGIGTSGGYYADTSPTNPTNTTTWTSGYTQGATSIVVGATTGLSVNMWIVLDQLNDTSDTGDIYVCQSGTTCTDEGGATNQRVNRAQREWHKVTAINGTTLTISPGLIMPNWRSGQTPGAWWGNSGDLTQGDGIEALTVEMQTPTRCIVLFYAENSYVKGVRCINPEGNSDFSNFGAILIYGGVHNTLRDSYIWGNQGLWASATYGFTTYGSGHNLIENNFQANRCCALFLNGDIGTVFGYNYALDSRYDASATFMQASNYMHEGGSAMNLNEGNDTIGAKNDIVHSTANLFVHNRNRYVGKDLAKTSETEAVQMYAYNRYMVFTGNVVGEDTYHTAYQAGTATSIWALGTAGNFARTAFDALTASTSMRWGNYDTFNDAVRWQSSEVPSGISVLPNSVPSTQTVPTSFYLSAKPSFFQSITWPPIGPDVTCASNCPTGVGTHVIKIPARICYESLSNDPAYADPGSGHERAKIFNALTCYGS